MPSSGQNLPQIVTHILQKAFFKHALAQKPWVSYLVVSVWADIAVSLICTVIVREWFYWYSLHNYSEDVIPRSVFANIIPGKNEKCAREIMLNMISVHRDVSVKVLNSYYFTINFIWFCLKKQAICDKWLVLVIIRHRKYLSCSK